MIINPRHEFRAFAPGFGIVEQRLRAGRAPTAIRESQEVYLVSRHSGDFNVKFRDGQLDIKKRLEQTGRFELWEPAVKLELPAPADRLAELLAPALGLEADQLPAGGKLDLDELLDAIYKDCPQVVIVDLFKRRFGFEIRECMAELAEVVINGAAIQTACIESTNLEALEALARSLGLDVYPNVNYVRALQRVTGLIRQPLF